MALPSIPRQELRYIEGEYDFTYSPMRVREEFNIIMSKDSSEENKELAMMTVLNDCINTDTKNLPIYIMEHAFIQVYIHSISDEIPMAYICKNSVPRVEAEGDNIMKSCGTKLKFNIDLKDIKVDYPDGFMNVFSITDNIGIGMVKVPPPFDGNLIKEDWLMNSIDTVFVGDEVMKFSDESEDDRKKFIASISFKQRTEIMNNYFMKYPSILYVNDIKCPECGVVHPFRYRNLKSIFA